MFILIEFTKDFKDYGVDYLPPYIFGFRLLGLKVHLVIGKFTDVFEVKKLNP